MFHVTAIGDPAASPFQLCQSHLAKPLQQGDATPTRGGSKHLVRSSTGGSGGGGGMLTNMGDLKVEKDK